MASEKKCLFCAIIAGSQPATRVWEDDQFVVFEDINKEAPIHVLIVPRKHISQPVGEQLSIELTQTLGNIFRVAEAVAKELKVTKNGYRLIHNVGAYGGQVINHFHVHLLSERPL